jgi:hypothetical protein
MFKLANKGSGQVHQFADDESNRCRIQLANKRAWPENISASEQWGLAENFSVIEQNGQPERKYLS